LQGTIIRLISLLLLGAPAEAVSFFVRDYVTRYEVFAALCACGVREILAF
jgi:hypothetical protein